MKNRVAVFAAHPDDEILGCGATIARHVLSGDEVAVVILAEGITSRNDPEATEQLRQLKENAKTANEKLGVKNLYLEAFPDNKMDSLPLLEVVQRIESFLQSFRPNIVYTHNDSDLNVDHQVVSRAVSTACRPLPNAFVQEIYFFEVASSTEWQTAPGAYFRPNHFVDVSDTLSKKLEALGAYAGEMRDWPHARSIRAVEHLARWRGATVGKQAAEAFYLARRVV